jgi:hypothetical protein
MTTDSIKQFVDEHDLSAADIIDALDIDASDVADVPTEPTDFYDGEPSIEQLADDFPPVQMILDERDSLQSERDDLMTDLREHRRSEFVDTAEELVAITDAYGTKADLIDQYEDGELTLDTLSEKLDRAKEIVTDATGSEPTTVSDDDDTDDRSHGFVADSARNESGERDIPRTENGKLILSEYR